MIISYTEFDLLSFSVADVLKGKLCSQVPACFIRIPLTFGVLPLLNTNNVFENMQHKIQP